MRTTIIALAFAGILLSGADAQQSNSSAFVSEDRDLASIPNGYNWKGPAVSWWATFSNDGSQVAYLARHHVGDHWYECVRTADFQSQDFASVVRMVFSPDGRKLAYLASSESNGQLPLFLIVGPNRVQVQYLENSNDDSWLPV